MAIKQLERKNNYCRILQDKINKLKTIIKLFKIKEKGRIAIGYDADFTIVDMNKERVITNDWIASKCGWTPYNNMKVKGWPIMTVIRDNIVMKDDIIFEPLGEPMNFFR